jgi:putative heme-binding domain-containing protein
MKLSMIRGFQPTIVACVFTFVSITVTMDCYGQGQPATDTLRHPIPFEALLKNADPARIAAEAVKRGDPRRGALLFYKSAAACAACHSTGQEATPLGPDLSVWNDSWSPAYLVESILYPSKVIRKDYQTTSVLMVDGKLISGMVVRQNDRELVLRDATDLLKEKVIPQEDIEAIRPLTTSMMPEGLIAAIGGQRDLYDLVSYVLAIAKPLSQGGGPPKAAELMPSADELLVQDDTGNIDHAGIIRRLGKRDFTAGESIYHGYCYSCHGSDGNTPSLPTARAFGTQSLKYGEDPYRMFVTLSKGNGLMGAMTQLTPRERYQVVHYIREQFIKPGKLDRVKIDNAYLESLPKGTDSGDRVLSIDRDYGPALASQLGRTVQSALTVRLNGMTISYDLHSMDIAGVWTGGFLDLDQTQHIRGRGEGTADPAGPIIPSLSYWHWGHAGTLDYPKESLLPRGPMPEDWMDYRGHYLVDDRVVLSYAIDQREILETPAVIEDQGNSKSPVLVQTLRIGGGRELKLALAPDGRGGATIGGDEIAGSTSDQVVVVPTVNDGVQQADRIAIGVLGDRDGITWSIDRQHRLVLIIPAGDQSRLIQLIRQVVPSAAGVNEQLASHQLVQESKRPQIDPLMMTQGGALRWPEVLSTTGYLGLESGGYQLDTLAVPVTTPWKTWFRTSAIDFFKDGRMVVTTYGGDVWIVSNVDSELLDLRWKRFAGGLYEPMGVKVVGGQIYVTCKDRITRLWDLNDDGEADFYESFSADPDVSVNFHAFNFDLQVDDGGNFYYAKSGHGADTDLPGVVYKVSPDGKYREIFSTGFRTPNGMGAMPGNRITASDNQGQWTPASKVILLRPGGFNGWVQTYDGKGKWAPGGGAIDITKIEPPKTFDRPLVWMPQVLDNSSGGQLWVDDPRWGPLSGRLLHTSFGRGWMYYLMMQDIGTVSQAAIVKLPFNFRSGIMRAAVNPVDGQVYAVGLDGWNGGGRPGLLDHGIERLRFTGVEYPMVSNCQVEPEGLRLVFNFSLDKASAEELAAYQVHHWNYKWQASYGSEMYSPTTGKVAVEPMNVTGAEVSRDRQSVLLRVDRLRPVDQVHILLKVASDSGFDFEEEIYWTINAVPSVAPGLGPDGN